jgi:SPP1 family predicted phage head-tail adaptor
MIRRPRHHGEIQEEVGAYDTYGERVESWQTVIKTCVRVEPLSGRELYDGRAVVADVTHRLRFRYQATLQLTARNRIKVGSRVFYFIEPPRNLREENRWWEVLARESDPTTDE